MCLWKVVIITRVLMTTDQNSLSTCKIIFYSHTRMWHLWSWWYSSHLARRPLEKDCVIVDVFLRNVCIGIRKLQIYIHSVEFIIASIRLNHQVNRVDLKFSFSYASTLLLLPGFPDVEKCSSLCLLLRVRSCLVDKINLVDPAFPHNMNATFEILAWPNMRTYRNVCVVQLRFINDVLSDG